MALTVPSTRFDGAPVRYDGKQLRSHWIYETYGLQGDACVAFIGPVSVPTENMVDLADRKQGLMIGGARMLHFIAESFGPDLERAIFMQRLLVLLAGERLRELGVKDLRRTGDDVFVGDGKLSVSIATVSAVSCLVHLGINDSTDDTPVKTAGLAQLRIDARAFAADILDRYRAEFDSMSRAVTKVRSVP